MDGSNSVHAVVGEESTAMINKTKGNMTRKTEKGYICDECGSVSQTLANLKKHMLTHSGERPFKCNACPKAFRQRHHLIDHQRTHTGERPFKCDQCGTRFVQRSSLNLHKKKHSGVKPYTCHICSNSFFEKMQLKLHMRMHTGEKPYQCEKCGRAFSTSTRLNFHRMIHTGERRYKCEECGVRFREKVTLQQHRGVHVNLGPFVCTECGQEFSRLAGLSLHRKVHTHKDDYLYVYDKEVNKAFASAAHIKSQKISNRQKEHSLGIEKCRYSDNNMTQKTVVGQKENENLKSLEIETDHDIFCVPEASTSSSSLAVHSNSSSPRKLTVSAAETYLQKLKENLVSNLNDNAHNFDSYINPNQVKAALDNGKLLETEDDEGNTFFIILPPSLKMEDVMLMSDSAQSRSHLPSNSVSVQNSDSTDDISGRKSVLVGIHSSQVCSEKVSISHGTSNSVFTNVSDSDMCVELHEEVPVEEPSNITVEVSQNIQDSGSDGGQVYSMEMDKELELDIGRYSNVRKDIHPDGTSLLLWNDILEHNNEITYIIDEGSHDPVMIDCQGVSGVNEPLKPKEKRSVISEEGKRCRKQRTETGSNSPIKITVKSKKMKEKKIRIPKVYNCGQCGKECKTSSNYIAHMRTHSGERPYFCDFCRRGFKQIAHLRSHVRIHTGERPYVCDICNFAFTQCSRLKSHKKTQHSEAKKKIKKKEKVEPEYRHRSFYCKICKKTFINECYKIEHMRNHRLSMPFSCKICGIQYKSKASLLKHRLTHTDYQCICEVCGVSFVDLGTLHKHRAMTHEIGAVESSGSDMCISVKIGEEQDFVVIVPPVNNMTNNDTSEIVVKEEVDIDILEASNGQVYHKVIQVTEEDGFVRSRLLTRPGVDEMEHLSGYKVPEMEKDHVEESGSIVREERKVTNTRSTYDCTSKNVVQALRKEFHTTSKPLEKIKEEQDEKNYKTIIDEFGKKIWACKLCDKTFLQSSNLHSHLRMHTGERPYECSVCGKAFKQITHLKDHMSRHTGFKPYKCSACSSCFAQRSALMRHIKHVHHGKASAVKNSQQMGEGKENGVKIKERGLETKNRKIIMNESHNPSSSGMKACDICKISHTETHEEGSFKCKYCNGIFKQRPLLESHECIHSCVKSCVCDCEVAVQSKDKSHSDRCNAVPEAGNTASTKCTCGPSCNHLWNNNKNFGCDSSDCINNVDSGRENENEKIMHSEQKNAIRQGESKREHMKEKFSCCSCQATFPDISSLKSHLLVHYSNLSEVCDACGMVFRRASALKFHQSVKHGRVDERYRDYNVTDEMDIKEEPCGQTGSELGQLGTEFGSDGEQIKESEIESCDEQEEEGFHVSNKKINDDNVLFSTKQMINSENADDGQSPIKTEPLESTHSGEYACRSCQKVFSRLSKLRNHEAMWCKGLEDLGEDNDVIVTTQEQSVKQINYHATMKKRKSRRNRKYSSDDDTDSEISEVKYSEAETSHPESGYEVKTEENPVASEILCASKQEPTLCKKKDELTVRKSRNVNSPLYCKICRKQYTKVNSYKVHMSAHLNKRPFKCDQCFQAFNQKAHLTSHYRRHTGERPYKCHHCPRAFTQPHCLKSHIKRLHSLNSSGTL